MDQEWVEVAEGVAVQEAAVVVPEVLMEEEALGLETVAAAGQEGILVVVVVQVSVALELVAVLEKPVEEAVVVLEALVLVHLRGAMA